MKRKEKGKLPLGRKTSPEYHGQREVGPGRYSGTCQRPKGNKCRLPFPGEDRRGWPSRNLFPWLEISVAITLHLLLPQGRERKEQPTVDQGELFLFFFPSFEERRVLLSTVNGCSSTFSSIEYRNPWILNLSLFSFTERFVSLRISEIHIFYNLQLFYWHFLEILWLFIFLVFYKISFLKLF